MTQMYAVYSENNEVRVLIPESTARLIVGRDAGYWDDYQSKKNPRTTLRIIRVTSDFSVTLTAGMLGGETVKLFFHHGDKLIPE